MSTETRCGPENCPIVTFSDLTPAEQRVQRARKAREMSERGFTEKQIAKQFGVSQATISSDLETLSETDNVKGQGKDTLGRKKSTGRPKDSTKSRKSPDVKAKHEKIVTLSDSGLSTCEVAVEVGVGKRMVSRVLEVETARRDATPNVTPEMLSLTAQQKLAAAIRQQEHQLELQFERRVRDEVKKRIDEIVLPHWKQQIDQAQTLYNARRALMDKGKFNMIRRALHRDSRLSISDKKLDEAFDAFMSLEKHLLDEKDSPTVFGKVPDNLAEWDKMKAKTTAERRAKRATANGQEVRRR